MNINDTNTTVSSPLIINTQYINTPFKQISSNTKGIFSNLSLISQRRNSCPSSPTTSLSSRTFLLSPLKQIHLANQMMQSSEPSSTNVKYSTILNQLNQTNDNHTNVICNNKHILSSSNITKSTSNGSVKQTIVTIASAPSTPARKSYARSTDENIEPSSLSRIISISRRRKGIYGTLPTEFSSPQYISKTFGSNSIRQEEKYRIKDYIDNVVMNQQINNTGTITKDNSSSAEIINTIQDSNVKSSSKSTSLLLDVSTSSEESNNV